jgi:hypothetical protein
MLRYQAIRAHVFPTQQRAAASAIHICDRVHARDEHTLFLWAQGYVRSARQEPQSGGRNVTRGRNAPGVHPKKAHTLLNRYALPNRP